MKMQITKNQRVDVENDDFVVRFGTFSAELKLDGALVRIPSNFLPVCLNFPEKARAIYRKMRQLDVSGIGEELIVREALSDADRAMEALSLFEGVWNSHGDAFFRQGTDSSRYEKGVLARVDGKFYQLFGSDRRVAELPPMLKSVDNSLIDANFNDLAKLKRHIGSVVAYASSIRQQVQRWLDWDGVSCGLNWIAEGNDPKTITDFTNQLIRISREIEYQEELRELEAVYKSFFVDEKAALARAGAIENALLERRRLSDDRAKIAKELDYNHVLRLEHGTLIYSPSDFNREEMYVTSTGEVYVRAPRVVGQPPKAMALDVETGLADKILEDPEKFGLVRLDDGDAMAVRAISMAKAADPKLWLFDAPKKVG